MNLKPLDDRVVVKPSEAEQTTASGLVIPDTAKEKPQQGTVLAVGPGRWSDAEASSSRSRSKLATPCSTASTAEPKSRTRATIS